MAAISIKSRGHVSIFVQVTGLTDTYSYNDRIITWYVDDEEWDTQELAAKVSSSEIFELTDLEPDTDYEIHAIIDGDEGMAKPVTLSTKSTSTRTTTFSVLSKTSDSITVKFTNAFSGLDYYLRIYDVTNGAYIDRSLAVDYDVIEDSAGYTIEDLEANTQYAINVGYEYINEDEDYESGITWVYPSGSALNVTTDKAIAYITARTYVQSADGSYSNYYSYSFDMPTDETINVGTWANNILQNYLSDDLSAKLLANISFDEMETETDDVLDSSDTYTPSKAGSFRVYFYFKRTTYYMTLAAETGIDDFTVNNTTWDKGDRLSYLYEQSITIKANLLSGYEFEKWTASPTTITAVHNKTSNPITFTMPASNFTLTANINKVTIKYNVRVYCYYELADSATGYEGGYEETLTIAEGTYLDFDDYYPDYLLTGFEYLEGTDGNGNVVSGITVNGNKSIEFYYTRLRYNLKVQNSDGGINYFKVNDVYHNIGVTMEYKYGQSIKVEAFCKGYYTFSHWTSDKLSGLSGNPVTFTMPNSSCYIEAVTEQGVMFEPWEWTEDEVDAFENRGPFDTLTAERWNEFLDWCNTIIEYKGGTKIGSSYYGTQNEPLYASDFNMITTRIGAVSSALSSDVKATKRSGDIIYGWYFTHLAAAMNALL